VNAAATGQQSRPCRLAAEWYVRRGLRVHPLRPLRIEPLLRDWPERATVDLERIREWWKRWPEAGVAIATGQGHMVLDVDPRHGGDLSLERLLAEHGAMPETWRCLTPRGGVHHYFRVPVRLGNRAGVWPGIDVRGDGGYVGAPPTVRDVGIYVWESEHAPNELPLADPPQWLLAALARSEGGATARPTEEWVARLRDGVDAGARNDAVARLAGHLLRRGISPRVVLELLAAWNVARCRPPLPDAEILRTVDSIAGIEAARRMRPC
jgi:hypothetical protein